MNGNATFRVHASVKKLKQSRTRVDHLTPCLRRVAMPPIGPGKTQRNERRYPYIVELAVSTDGLDVEAGGSSSFISHDTFNRDTDVSPPGKVEDPIIAGASPICRPPPLSSNSSAEYSTSQTFELR